MVKAGVISVDEIENPYINNEPRSERLAKSQNLDSIIKNDGNIDNNHNQIENTEENLKNRLEIQTTQEATIRKFESQNVHTKDYLNTFNTNSEVDYFTNREAIKSRIKLIEEQIAPPSFGNEGVKKVKPLQQINNIKEIIHEDAEGPFKSYKNGTNVCTGGNNRTSQGNFQLEKLSSSRDKGYRSPNIRARNPNQESKELNLLFFQTNPAGLHRTNSFDLNKRESKPAPYAKKGTMNVETVQGFFKKNNLNESFERKKTIQDMKNLFPINNSIHKSKKKPSIKQPPPKRTSKVCMNKYSHLFGDVENDIAPISGRKTTLDDDLILNHERSLSRIGNATDLSIINDKVTTINSYNNSKLLKSKRDELNKNKHSHFRVNKASIASDIFN